MFLGIFLEFLKDILVFLNFQKIIKIYSKWLLARSFANTRKFVHGSFENLGDATGKNISGSHFSGRSTTIGSVVCAYASVKWAVMISLRWLFRLLLVNTTAKKCIIYWCIYFEWWTVWTLYYRTTKVTPFGIQRSRSCQGWGWDSVNLFHDIKVFQTILICDFFLGDSISTSFNNMAVCHWIVSGKVAW